MVVLYLLHDCCCDVLQLLFLQIGVVVQLSLNDEDVTRKFDARERLDEARIVESIMILLLNGACLVNEWIVMPSIMLLTSRGKLKSERHVFFVILVARKRGQV